MKPIYLDYAAATPMDESALKAMQPYLSERFYNPSAAYQAAREVRRDVEAARATVADVLGSKDQEIIFTAGGTEANNLAVHGILANYPGAHLVVSAIEHESILEPAGQYDHTVVPVTSEGLLDLGKLENSIGDNTVLVSVMYANNEIGTIQPVAKISQLIKTIRAERIKAGNKLPLWLHADAAQAANYLDLQVSRLGVDLMTLNGGKIYGAKQSGCLYIRAGVALKPMIRGGGQESALRNGTENVAALCAFATMLQKVNSERKGELKRLEQIREKYIATLSQNNCEFEVNGTMKHRLPNNLNISLPGADGERLLMELDNAGVLVATGSACSAGADAPSHVLLAIGKTEREAAGSLRITFGRPTTEAEAVKAARVMAATIQQRKRLV